MTGGEHYWPGPPPKQTPPAEGYFLAIRAGAPNAPRCFVDMGGFAPKALGHEPVPEVIDMRNLYPNVPREVAAA